MTQMKQTMGHEIFFELRHIFLKMSEIEVPLGFVKQSYVYKIPPARTTRGHKASDWYVLFFPG